MIPLCVPDVSGNEGRYLQECVDSTFLSSVGPFVTRFEGMVASAAGSAQASATASGTTAIQLALVAVGVQAGDLVAVPSYTFIASVNAISHCGAIPWLFDVDSGSWTLDPGTLAAALTRDCDRTAAGLIHRASGRRVAAILPVQTLGIPADMDAIAAIAHDFRLRLVSDSAAALGATYKGRPAGQWGADLTAFSFNGNKTVTCGGGGAVVGDDAELVGLVRHLGSTARVGSDYSHDRIGYNHRMTNLEAAVGCAQMERLEAFIAAKRRIAATYGAAFAHRPDLGAFPQPAWGESACWFSGVVTSGAGQAQALRAHLRVRGIDARPFWKPAHLQAPYLDAPRLDMARSERLWERVVTLPCSTNLTEADQATAIQAVLDGLDQP